ncbi:MAG: elongation factor P [Planctomycetes bacterium DG_23]|nr:MAG: elongation factor P [Planctomycetes bacterium DG_23]
MISTNDLRPGITIMHRGDIHQVVEFQHVKPGKGGAFVRTKLKNLETGATVEHTYKGEQKVEQVILTDRKMEYLYRQGDTYYFMDLDTYEQVPLSAGRLGAGRDFLKENTQVTWRMAGEKIVEIVLPDFVELEVADTEPGLRGDTVSGSSKPARLETGLEVNVPLFIQKGDVVKLDTRSGEYVERVRSA